MSATKHSVNWLPEDLILEVILRLPRKPLIRLRCLSKRLRNSIDCTLFKKRYDVFHNSVTDFKVMIIGEDHRLFSVDFHLPDSPNSSNKVKEISTPGLNKFPVFMGCCKGIVCLFLFGSGPLQMFILVNPFNGTFQNVNCNNVGPFNPQSSIGFGYDYATDDYKIVSLPIQGNDIYVDVYSMRRDSWGRIAGKFSPGMCSDYTNVGIYVEGAIHWLWINGNVFSCIAAFDLETESFRSVPLPPQLQSSPFLKLHDLGGRLSVLVRSPSSNSSGIINVWMMKEYGVATSWTPLFNIRIEIDNIIGHFPIWDDARLLCLGPDSRLWSWLNTQDGTKENILIHKLPHGPHVHQQRFYGGIRSWVCVRSPLRLRCSYVQND